jgi:hypothetical protein
MFFKTPILVWLPTKPFLHLWALQELCFYLQYFFFESKRTVMEQRIFMSYKDKLIVGSSEKKNSGNF